jgi:CRISPR/Cas system-associated exonuclease Cas4 (RecB family)
MGLTSDFQFSQSNLQDYAICRRRFQLRHLLKLAWPGVEVEPALEHERLLLLGAVFHGMIHQAILGIPSDRLLRMAREPELKIWWDNFQAYGMQDLPGEVSPEVMLSTTVRGFRVLAKYDLIAIHEDGRLVIVDWKTTLKRPSRAALMNRLQSKVYPYLLVRAGNHLVQADHIVPEQIEMIYWFAEHPQMPERFKYDQHKFQQDENELSSMIEEIAGLDEDQFNLTENEQFCTSCLYRSLCQRGVIAGPIDSWSEEQSTNDEFFDEQEYGMNAGFGYGGI